MIDPWTALLLGLVGSVHCAAMCGPLALALPVTGSNDVSFFAGRIAYNLGRMATYCLMGIVFGCIGQTLFFAGAQRWMSIGLGLLVLAGLLLSPKLALWQPVTLLVNRLKAGMSRQLQRRSIASLGLLGLLNGLLPCGLVYVACAGAAATGGVLAGTGYMVLFGAGTVPMMLAIGLSGRLVPLSMRLLLRRAIPVSVFLVAALLILRGMSLGIPYLSPDLAAGSCCHK